MGFIRFTDTGARLGEPQVSIWSRGQLGFNQGAIQEFEIRKYQYVVLYYDPDTQHIGFQLTNDKNEAGAIKLIFRDKSGASISAIPFLRINKISYTESKKYAVSLDPYSGFLVIDLNKPV